MAICVVGGLITSTLLTLVVVPVVFTYIDDFQQWIVKRLPKPDHHHDPEKQPQSTSASSPASKH
jgi:predicted RND superfamily exporter protein